MRFGEVIPTLQISTHTLEFNSSILHMECAARWWNFIYIAHFFWSFLQQSITIYGTYQCECQTRERICIFEQVSESKRSFSLQQFQRAFIQLSTSFFFFTFSLSLALLQSCCHRFATFKLFSRWIILNNSDRFAGISTVVSSNTRRINRDDDEEKCTILLNEEMKRIILKWEWKHNFGRFDWIVVVPLLKMDGRKRI